METNSIGQKQRRNLRRVVLFGESLFLDTVEAILDDFPGIRVVRIDAAATDFEDHFRSASPDVIILDLHTPQFQSIAVLLREQPGTPVLCMDVNSKQIITLSSQRHAPLTVESLGQVIQTHAFKGNGRDAQAYTIGVTAFNKKEETQ